MTTGTTRSVEWLLSLSKEDRLEVGSDIANIEYKWPVGPPRCTGASHWKMAYSKYEAVFPAVEPPGCFSLPGMTRYFCCTASSKKTKDSQARAGSG